MTQTFTIYLPNLGKIKKAQIRKNKAIHLVLRVFDTTNGQQKSTDLARTLTRKGQTPDCRNKLRDALYRLTLFIN